MKKLLFVLTVIISLNIGMTVGICGDEPDYPQPWSTDPIEEEV